MFDLLDLKRLPGTLIGNAVREEQVKVLNVANRESSQQLLPSDFFLEFGPPFRSFSATDPIVRGK